MLLCCRGVGIRCPFIGSPSLEQSASGVQTPGKYDGEGDFIELNARPVGNAVNPEILVKSSIVSPRLRYAVL